MASRPATVGVVAPPTSGQVLSNSFVSSVGWVKPGDAYPFTLTIDNYDAHPGARRDGHPHRTRLDHAQRSRRRRRRRIGERQHPHLERGHDRRADRHHAGHEVARSRGQGRQQRRGPADRLEGPLDRRGADHDGGWRNAGFERPQPRPEGDPAVRRLSRPRATATARSPSSPSTTSSARTTTRPAPRAHSTGRSTTPPTRGRPTTSTKRCRMGSYSRTGAFPATGSLPRTGPTREGFAFSHSPDVGEPEHVPRHDRMQRPSGRPLPNALPQADRKRLVPAAGHRPITTATTRTARR